MIDNPKFGNLDKTRLDHAGEYPEVVEGSADNPVGLKPDTQSVVMGQGLMLEERGYHDSAKAVVANLPEGTKRMLGI